MVNQITGRIESIGAIEEIHSKDGTKTYYKREIVIDATRCDPYTGERGFESYPSFEFGGDRCKELDNYEPGQIVTVSFDISGVKYNDKITNEVKYFNKVRGFKIELRQNQSRQQASVSHPSQNEMPVKDPADDLPF
jgi:single-strand DNA-binding protein